jgi:hypothetical protein
VLLQKRGVVKETDKEQATALKSRSCPHCFTPNRPDAQFCNTCRLVFSLDSYNDVLNRQKEKELQIKHLIETQSTQIDKFKEDMERKFQQILLRIDVNKVINRD